MLGSRRKQICLQLGWTLQEFDEVQSVLSPYFPDAPDPEELYRPAHYYEECFWKRLGEVESARGVTPDEAALARVENLIESERRARELGAQLLRSDRPLREEALDVMKEVFANLCRKREQGG